MQTNLKVLLYMGTQRARHQKVASLADYDVVLASYGIVMYDGPARGDKVLFRSGPW